MSTDARLLSEARKQEIRERADAATPGPWEREHGIIWGDSGHEKVVYSRALTHDVNTLAFIAAAREDVPALLAHAEAQAEHIAALERLAYVPGRWVCPKCGCTLGKSVLSAADGEIYASTERGECPNDGTPMDHVTWQEDAEVTQRWAAALEERSRELVALLRRAEGLLGTRHDHDCDGAVYVKPHDMTWCHCSLPERLYLATDIRAALEGK